MQIKINQWACLWVYGLFVMNQSSLAKLSCIQIIVLLQGWVHIPYAQCHECWLVGQWLWHFYYVYYVDKSCIQGYYINNLSYYIMQYNHLPISLYRKKLGKLITSTLLFNKYGLSLFYFLLLNKEKNCHEIVKSVHWKEAF